MQTLFINCFNQLVISFITKLIFINFSNELEKNQFFKS